MHALFLVLGLAFAGCAGSETPDSETPTEPADESSDDAADAPAPDTCLGQYRVDSPCMNEDNFAACQAAEAECPGWVAVMESCPLQFRCGR